MIAERSTEAQLLSIPVGAIQISGTNPRKSFDPVAMEELKSSVGQQGILEPPLFRPLPMPEAKDGEVWDQEYELVTGERRYRAACALGMIEMPGYVRVMTDAEAREIQITENLQRADIHPVEEAEAYRLLIADSAAHGLGRDRRAEDIARRLGKSTAYVAQRLKLLDLELDAKIMFAKGHLTLDHALLLAKLTPKDQERALYFLVKADPKFDKRSLTEVIGSRLENLTNWGHGGRLVEPTSAQLKGWISTNVLLQLKGVPWRLEDETLVPTAGACDTCPKRSGSNTALFGDLTAEEDVCLDPTCFEAKQKATLARHKETAKASGGKLLKISAKPSHDKLQEPAIDRRPLKEAGGVVVGESVTVTKKAVKEGQWVAAEPGSCPDAVEALMVDGKEQGKMKTVCANQACKVHKHRVNTPLTSGHGPSVNREEERRREVERQLAFEKTEVPIFIAVFAAIRAVAKPDPAEELRWQLMSHCEESADTYQAAAMLGIKFTPSENGWQRQRNAAESVEKYIKKATLDELLLVAMVFRHKETLDVGDSDGSNRAELWKLAKAHKVNADAIVKALAAPAAPKAIAVPAKKVASKKTEAKKVPAKKTALKKVVAKKRAVVKKTAAKKVAA